jgi:hypothetical protein
MKHPANAKFGEPDLHGVAGEAWMVDAKSAVKKPDQQAVLAFWQATIPGAHPFWHSYAISVIHLRPIAGVKDAHKHYPEAVYEICVLALDPDKPLSDPKDGGNFEMKPLVPLNLQFQFHGITDEQAGDLARALVGEYVSGRISPDTDFRSYNIRFVREYVERFLGSCEK